MDSPASHLVRDQPLPHGLDYFWLRQTGLYHLHQLCGTSWTDYNEHDPGVTLLEALCYQLTAIGNQATQPIPALMAAGATQPAPSFGPTLQTLATPPPVTLADYERLVHDKLPRLVKRVEIRPLTTPHQPAPDTLPAAAGLYSVRIEPCPPPLAGLALDPHKLQAEVLHVLNFHRNLGEVFATATVLKPRPVAVGGHLALEVGQDPGPILTDLLLELGHQLPHLAALKHPVVKHVPFFRQSPPAGTELASSVAKEAAFQLKYASRTAGIHTLAGLYVQPIGNPAPELADDEVAVLDPAQTLAYLTVTQQGFLISFDYQQVLRAYYAQTHYLEARVQGLPAPQQQPLAGSPAATDYGSVQELLPPLYGIGSEGPGPRDSATQRADIMQLKGYLLLFDQLLANVSAQLRQVGAYFSPEPLPNSEALGLLYEVPYVAPLLPDTAGPDAYILPDAAWQNTRDAVHQWQCYRQNPANAYVKALEQLASTSASPASSRLDFLKHLLARLGYAAMPLSTDSDESPAAIQHQTIRTYERLLRHVEEATSHRAAARLPTHVAEATGGRAESGLEFILYLLTGLEPLARKWSHHGHLTDLEIRLRTHGEPADAHRLVLRGEVADFEQVLADLTEHLHPSGAPADEQAPDPSGWYWELTGPGATGQLRREHLQHIASCFERFCLLDHAVLRPLPVSATDKHEPFYECQATVLLPGYAPRFRHGGPHRGPHNAHNRRLVTQFIHEFGPAYLHLHVLWLDYPAMRQWEGLYAALARASGLLNRSGHSHPESLPEAQLQARRFLQRYLHSTHQAL